MSIQIDNPNQHRIEANQTVDLAQISTRADGHYSLDRKAAEKEFKELRRELRDLQFRLYAEGKRSLLLVLQAMDAGGKDGTIRRVFQGVNPQGVVVTSFKAPSKEELAHDFLWRIHQATPEKGMIGVFNRSHYEDVLIVRVRNIAPESVWRPRYDHINNFERLLIDSNTVIRKFYLHISKEEQRERLQARIDDPSRNWKFDIGDLDQRKYWGDYQVAFTEMLEQCSTQDAPWYVIPSDQKWYRNLAITRVLVQTLRDMDPQYPPVTADLSGITIE